MTEQASLLLICGVAFLLSAAGAVALVRRGWVWPVAGLLVLVAAVGVGMVGFVDSFASGYEALGYFFLGVALLIGPGAGILAGLVLGLILGPRKPAGGA